MIKLEHVTKRFDETAALDDVSFSVGKGEIIGFVGPNGAGKTTAMKIITTYSLPTEGSVSVGGYDVRTNPMEIRRILGYLPETVPLYNDMLVHEYLAFIGEARHLNGTFKKRREWVIDACGLEPVLNRQIGVLSKGFKQRTCLAQALIHDPDVLILDEPTTGLDPLQIIGIRNLIKDLAEKKTIIFSTHILSEVATIADRILVINEGRIVGDGSFRQLRDSVTDQSTTVLEMEGADKDAIKLLSGIAGVDHVEESKGKGGNSVCYTVKHTPGSNVINDVNKLIQKGKWKVLALYQDELSLEESFIRLTAGPTGKQNSRQGGAE